MIPDQNTLIRFLKARMNFFVYGPRATGKTTLLKKVFNDVNVQYIYINCTIADRKTNFFRYLNHQFDKFFRRKLKQDQKASKALKQYYTKPSDPSSVHAWIQNIRSLSPQVRQYLQHIYFFIDNIQQIHVSANFMTTFFSACQQNSIDDLKIPFVFCGITLPKKVYAVDKPFRNIISFCMKKPTRLMQSIIKKIVTDLFIQKFRLNNDMRKKFTFQDIQTAANILSTQIYAAFEPMQTDLNRIKKMTHVLGKEIAQAMWKQIKQQEDMKKFDKDKTMQSRMKTKINRGEIKVYTREMLEQGPVGDFLLKRKVYNQALNEQTAVQLPYEYYPNLILTSLHLADLAHQKDDKRRFQDYTKQKGRMHANMQNKITKHNIQRIIAISQVLQSVGKKDGPQFQLDHHSINYYACFQFLRQEEKIFVQGKNLSFASTKIYGDTKQQEAITFMKDKLDQKYSDFDPNQ